MWIWRFGVGSVDTLQESLALMAVDKFFHCQYKKATVGDMHFVGERLDVFKERFGQRNSGFDMFHVFMPSLTPSMRVVACGAGVSKSFSGQRAVET
jgi:hypothetical protein